MYLSFFFEEIGCLNDMKLNFKKVFYLDIGCLFVISFICAFTLEDFNKKQSETEIFKNYD